MKILALYLPQFHEVKENNEWWGEGYTEWNAVRNAKPLFNGHIQPRLPLDDNYYDLADPNAKTWAWQANLAKKYGVYGFCIYHYWFKDGRQLLQKPMEILLNHPEIDIKYCVCWANETWRRTWYGRNNEILLEQTYGGEKEWIEHFNYLVQFFNDERYIKIDNKPVVNIYRTFEIEDFEEMRNCWNKLAIDNGFSGIFFVSGTGMHGMDDRRSLFDAYYVFEPGFSLVYNLTRFRRLAYKFNGLGNHIRNSITKKKHLERRIDIRWLYDGTICYLERMKKTNTIVFPGVCPMWDNTPRRGYLGFVTLHSSPEVFHDQLKRLAEFLPSEPNDFLYVNAWNEWGEGTYLEPDQNYKYGYLEAIERAVNEN